MAGVRIRRCPRRTAWNGKMGAISALWLFLALSSAANSTSVSPAAHAVQDDYGAPDVQVRREGDGWIIEGRKNRISLDPNNLQMTAHTATGEWSTVASFPGDLTIEASGTSYSLRLADATPTVSPYETGYKTGLKISLA